MRERLAATSTDSADVPTERVLKFTKTERQPPHSITACVDGCVQHSIDGSSGLGEGETGGLTPCACFSDLLSERESGWGQGGWWVRG